MSNGNLIARVQDRAREHTRDYAEIAKFREIEKALSELSALRAAFLREEESHQDALRKLKALNRRLSKGE